MKGSCWIAVVVLGAAGCGDDSSTEASGSGGGTTASSTTGSPASSGSTTTTAATTAATTTATGSGGADCDGTDIRCEGACVDLGSDPDNCGSCGIECGAAEVCDGGDCVETCGGGTTECGGACVDTETSREHCGGCDLPCVGQESCVEGTCQVVCGDLRLWLPFDEKEGDPVGDFSGCSNQAEATLVTRGEPGRSGNAYRFNGDGVTGAHVRVLDSVSLGGMTAVTVEAWVFHEGGSFEAVVSAGDGVTESPSYIVNTYSDSDLAMGVSFYPSCNGVAHYRNEEPIPQGVWTHVAVSQDTAEGGTIRTFMDGTLRSEEPNPFSGAICDLPQDLLVGVLSTDGTWGWQGLIDELKIWGVARTEAEVCEDAGGSFVGGDCIL